MFKNLTRILVTLPFVLMTGGALASHTQGHDQEARGLVLLLEARVAALEEIGGIGALQTALAAAVARIEALEALTASMSADATNVFFDGVNVHIRNGTTTTDGTPNGLGNLIIGYDEARISGSDKSGSHNLIIGREHNYTSFGGLVAGFRNTISDQEASVSGGAINTASGDQASVSGGINNTASGNRASVSGGDNNTASSPSASVSGGINNTASFFFASVSGGENNTASGDSASVSGGDNNTASARGASVLGGVAQNATAVNQTIPALP